MFETRQLHEEAHQRSEPSGSRDHRRHGARASATDPAAPRIAVVGPPGRAGRGQGRRAHRWRQRSRAHVRWICGPGHGRRQRRGQRLHLTAAGSHRFHREGDSRRGRSAFSLRQLRRRCAQLRHGRGVARGRRRPRRDRPHRGRCRLGAAGPQGGAPRHRRGFFRDQSGVRARRTGRGPRRCRRRCPRGERQYAQHGDCALFVHDTRLRQTDIRNLRAGHGTRNGPSRRTGYPAGGQCSPPTKLSA